MLKIKKKVFRHQVFVVTRCITCYYFQTVCFENSLMILHILSPILSFVLGYNIENSIAFNLPLL